MDKINEMCDDSDRVRARMNLLRSGQSSKLEDRIAHLKKTDPEMFNYIRQLENEFIQSARKVIAEPRAIRPSNPQTLNDKINHLAEEIFAIKAKLGMANDSAENIKITVTNSSVNEPGKSSPQIMPQSILPGYYPETPTYNLPFDVDDLPGASAGDLLGF